MRVVVIEELAEIQGGRLQYGGSGIDCEGCCCQRWVMGVVAVMEGVAIIGRQRETGGEKC